LETGNERLAIGGSWIDLAIYWQRWVTRQGAPETEWQMQTARYVPLQRFGDCRDTAAHVLHHAVAVVLLARRLSAVWPCCYTAAPAPALLLLLRVLLRLQLGVPLRVHTRLAAKARFVRG
jgi:hypothetical protein